MSCHIFNKQYFHSEHLLLNLPSLLTLVQSNNISREFVCHFGYAILKKKSYTKFVISDSKNPFLLNSIKFDKVFR